MIEVRLIPQNVRGTVLQAGNYTLEDWKSMSHHWPEVVKWRAHHFLSQGEAARGKTLAEDSKKVLSELIMGIKKEDVAEIVITLFCLSDDDLRVVVAALPVRRI